MSIPRKKPKLRLPEGTVCLSICYAASVGALTFCSVYLRAAYSAMFDADFAMLEAPTRFLIQGNGVPIGGGVAFLISTALAHFPKPAQGRPAFNPWCFAILVFWILACVFVLLRPFFSIMFSLSNA